MGNNIDNFFKKKYKGVQVGVILSFLLIVLFGVLITKEANAFCQCLVGGPSCKLSFSPSSLMSPGSTDYNLSYRCASKYKISCSGPLSFSSGWKSLSLNIPWTNLSGSLYFNSNQYGKEKCTVYVYNRYYNGTRKCKASVNVKEPYVTYDHKSCYNNDVWWYDSKNRRSKKAQECGNSYCDTGGDVYKYCKNGDVWGLYDYRNRGCSGSSCYDSWSYNSCGDRLIETCGAGETCSGGVCVCTDECTEDVCDGNKYKTCADHDGDGCLELDSGTNCKAFSCTSGEWTCQDWNTLEKDTSCNEAGCDVTKGGCYDDPDSTATITEDCQSGEICKNDQCVEDSSDGNWMEVAP